MKKVFITLLIIILIASFVGTGYFLYQKSVEPPVVHETTTPFYTDIVKKTVATGTIVPRREIEIKSQVPGIVEKLYVEAGEKVTEGQTLAKIKIVPDLTAVARAEASLETAKINLDNAQKELKRQQGLYNQKVISEVEYNRFLLDFKLSQQELVAAEDNLQILKEGYSKNSGAVSNIVRATVSGTVLDMPVETGNRVIESNTFNEGTTIAFIADMSDMIFEGKVDESEVGKISEGMPLVLKVGAIDTEAFDATLEFISPKGVEEEGAIQFEIRAAIALKENVGLRAGYSANADIVLEKKDSVLAIQESNLIFEQDKIYVDIETAPQQFERKAIETGISDGINIEVVSGVEEDTKIKKNGTFGKPA